MAEAKADLCTMCFEKPAPGQGIVIDCGHLFCKGCIIHARGMDRRCPNCRRLSDMAHRDEVEQAAAQERWVRELQDEEDQRQHHGADVTQRDAGTDIAVEEEVTARQHLDDIATAAAQQRFEARLAALPEPDVPVARGGAPTDVVDLVSSSDENHDDAGEDAPGSGSDGEVHSSSSRINVTCENEKCTFPGHVRKTRPRKWRAHVSESSLPKKCFHCSCICRVNEGAPTTRHAGLRSGSAALRNIPHAFLEVTKGRTGVEPHFFARPKLTPVATSDN